MKTILNPILKKFVFRMGGIALSVVMALSMIAAVLPQTAQAAGLPTATCADSYMVKNGDTKGMIADTFGLKWYQIEAANHMASTDKLVAGKILCIPTKQWADAVNLGTMTASATGKKLSVKMSDFLTRGVWNVRVKDATGGINDYYKLGRIIAPDNGTVTGIYNLPQQLDKTPRLEVCVTNADSSVTVCTKIDHAL